MRLTHWERMTLRAILERTGRSPYGRSPDNAGDAGPHRVSVLRSLVRRGLITDRQALTPAGLRLAVEEATNRWDAQVGRMRDAVREHRRRFGG